MNNDISPFIVSIPEAELEALHTRLQHTRWPEAETTGNWDQGIPLHYTRELADYWLHEYDWRRFEKKLNAWP